MKTLEYHSKRLAKKNTSIDERIVKRHAFQRIRQRTYRKCKK